MFRKSYADLTRQGRAKRFKSDISRQMIHVSDDLDYDQHLNDEQSGGSTQVHPESATVFTPQLSLIDNADCSDESDFEELLDFHSDCSSESEDKISIDELHSLKKKLSDWRESFQINLLQMTALLGILKSHKCFSDLPSDSRTLVKTPSYVPIVPVNPGYYSHIGLEKHLREILKLAKERVSHLKLLVNIDGLPLFKSSGTELWPILGAIENVASLRKHVFPIGVFCGSGKPKDSNIFLQEFVAEIKELINKGFEIDGKLITVSIKGFICDAPAKAFILNIKGHTGYYSCTKCTQSGVWIHNRMTFPECDAAKRTSEAFLRQDDEDFHTGTSLLATIPGLDFLSAFPLDYMHLICLGVVRTLLYIWNFGPVPLKLPSAILNDISKELILLQHHVPHDFNRKPRSLTEIKRWKATEFRQFLLYTGPVVLKLKLEEDYKPFYDHFLSLSVAISILLSPKFSKINSYFNYAKQLLEHFVKTTKNLYGRQYLTYNMHGLIHISDSIEDFGPLDFSSAFPFENYLQYLKKRIHKGNRPLQQIVKRLHELMISDSSFPSEIEQYIYPVLSKIHFNGPVPCGLNISSQYASIELQNYKITNRHPNCYCYMSCGSVVVVENIVITKESKQILICREFLEKTDFFNGSLIASSSLNIYLVSKLSGLIQKSVSDIAAKMIVLPFKNNKVAFPLIHCLN